jgi:DNA-binding transcriptional LysR family regulator
MDPARDDLMVGSLLLFCRAAELESFVAAARDQGLTAAAVSRSIARLEAHLGVRLFQRTTRRVRLTEQGTRYYRSCRAALAALSEGERELRGGQVEPEGRVRISLPTPLGHRRILPLLAVFRARFPRVSIDIHLGNRNVDLIAEGFDLAVRGREPPDSGLVARLLIDEPLLVVAAPAYLAAAGVPDSLESLARHECVQFILPSSGQPVPWLFRVVGEDVSVPTRGGFSVADDLLGAITLVRHGAGLLQVPRFMVEAELQEGSMVEVLGRFGGRTRPFSLLYPAQPFMPLRVRLLVDFLVESLRSHPGGSTLPVPET